MKKITIIALILVGSIGALFFNTKKVGAWYPPNATIQSPVGFTALEEVNYTTNSTTHTLSLERDYVYLIPTTATIVLVDTAEIKIISNDLGLLKNQAVVAMGNTRVTNGPNGLPVFAQYKAVEDFDFNFTISFERGSGTNISFSLLKSKDRVKPTDFQEIQFESDLSKYKKINLENYMTETGSNGVREFIAELPIKEGHTYIIFPWTNDKQSIYSNLDEFLEDWNLNQISDDPNSDVYITELNASQYSSLGRVDERYGETVYPTVYRANTTWILDLYFDYNEEQYDALSIDTGIEIYESIEYTDYPNWIDVSDRFTFLKKFGQTEYSAIMPKSNETIPKGRYLVYLGDWYYDSITDWNFSSGDKRKVKMDSLPDYIAPPMESSQMSFWLDYTNPIDISDIIIMFKLKNLNDAPEKYNFQIFYMGDIDEVKPIINFQETQVISVEWNERNLWTTNKIMSYVTAFDDVDGDLTNQIEITSNTWKNFTDLGEYEIKLRVEDSSGNAAEASIHIILFDNTPPTITGVEQLRTSNTNKISIDTIKNTLVVTDSHSGNNLKLTVVEDTYTASYKIIGTHKVVFEAQDLSGNVTRFEVTIYVFDSVVPILSGTFYFTKSRTAILTIEQILTHITAHDDADGDITDRIQVIEDLFTGNGSKVGTYIIQIGVSDTTGNKANRNVIINVVDDIPPVIIIDSYILVSKSTILTHKNFQDILMHISKLDSSRVTSLILDIDDYSKNSTTPGEYVCNYSIATNAGEEEHGSIVIKVTDLDAGEKQKGSNDFFSNFIKWVQSAFTKIKDSITQNPKQATLIGAFVVCGILVLVIAYKKRKN